MLHDLLEALRLLTFFPAGAKRKNAKARTRAMFFFPLIGLAIGVISLWFAALVQPFGPPKMMDLVLFISPILLSRAVHLRSWTYASGALAEGKTKSETLRLMKDHVLTVGGVIGMTLLLMAKWELLQTLPFKPSNYLLALTASRWAPVALAYFVPPAVAETDSAKVELREFGGASAFIFLLMLLVQGVGILVFLGLTIFLAALAYWIQKKAGGVTEELLYATTEISEVFAFLFVTVFIR